MKNFGNIKDTFNAILSESIFKKDNSGKKLFSDYLNIIKENNSLKSKFLIYKNLTSKKFTKESDAKYFINENISLLKELDKKEINEGIEKLNSLLKDEELVTENEEIYNHINTLVETKKTASTIEKIQNSLNFISDIMLKEEINMARRERVIFSNVFNLKI